MRINLYVNNGKTPVAVLSSMAQIPFHTPTRRDVSWKLVDDAGKVLAAYTPPHPRKASPCTPYEGSWAQQEAQRRVARIV